MIQYKGYYIDHVYFFSKADIDNFLKRKAIERFKTGVRLFMKDVDMGSSIYVDNCARQLNEIYGLSFDEIEQIEINTMKEFELEEGCYNESTHSTHRRSTEAVS